MPPPVHYEHIYTMLEEIFESSILEADTSDLISNLGELYDSFNGQGFEESFERILLYTLSESKRSTDIAKLLRFIAESTVTLDNKYKAAAGIDASNEEIDDIVHPLLKSLCKTLNQWSQASSYIVRFRSCQLLYTILTYIQDHGLGEIDTETYENTGKLIERRRRDVSSNVRAHAVLLSKFFQDPTTVNDPVVVALCWQMQHDPNPRVRQNIVSIIAACEETIIPIANRFLYDKHLGVRNAALLHICKRIGPRSFSPAQRIVILHKCLTDPSDVIRHNAEQKLIPVWFRACGDKLSRFFKLLRVNNYQSLDNIPFIRKLINILLKCIKISQIVEEFELDMNSCLPKLPLSGEKVFLWRHLFINSSKDQRLSKFIAPLDNLIPFVLKCFDDCSSDEVEVCVFTELILFLMDIMETSGIQKCDEVFPLALKLMRHPFVPQELMPLVVTLYLTFSPKEKDIVHNDIVEVVEDLQKLIAFRQSQEKHILLKCFGIASQVLTEETTLTPAIKRIKDELIIHYLDSLDEDIKSCAISALASYCLLDIKEAKLSWSTFEEAIHMKSGPLNDTIFEGMFSILQWHGSEVFADLTNDGQNRLESILMDILKSFEDKENDEPLLTGVLKLYMDHKIVSPTLLAHAVVLYFHPNDYTVAQYDLEKFFPLFSETKAGYDCLVQSFLNVIDLLFDASKKSPLYEISIKKAATQLLEFSSSFEKQIQSNEDKFQDLLALRLCNRFLKKPWRLSASDLYSLSYQIMPAKFETLLNLKELVVQILKSLQSSIFQQKNPYAKKSKKSFSNYLKKIQQALNASSLIECSSKDEIDSPIQKRLEYDTSCSQENSPLRDTEIQVDTSSLSDVSGSDESKSQSSVCASLSSAVERLNPQTPICNSAPSEGETPNKVPEPTPCKIATRSRLSRKTPGPSAKKTVPNDTFKTPGPRQNKSQIPKLDIALTKTC